MRPDDESGKGGTLSGKKRDVYVLLKIFKLLFGVSITSFSLKFSIDRSLEDVRYETAPVGESLKRAMRYYTTRGKFHGVHPDLAKIGVKEIKIDYDQEKIGFIFARGRYVMVIKYIPGIPKNAF